jgi:hypothetical protein
VPEYTYTFQVNLFTLTALFKVSQFAGGCYIQVPDDLTEDNTQEDSIPNFEFLALIGEDHRFKAYFSETTI